MQKFSWFYPNMASNSHGDATIRQGLVRLLRGSLVPKLRCVAIWNLGSGFNSKANVDGLERATISFHLPICELSTLLNLPLLSFLVLGSSPTDLAHGWLSPDPLGWLSYGLRRKRQRSAVSAAIPMWRCKSGSLGRLQSSERQGSSAAACY